ncbi:hypothetical protein ACQJBY_027580 [Aegilops geniculata]
MCRTPTTPAHPAPPPFPALYPDGIEATTERLLLAPSGAPTAAWSSRCQPSKAYPGTDTRRRASSSHMPGRATGAPRSPPQRECSATRCCSSRRPALPKLGTGSPPPSPRHRRPALPAAAPSPTRGRGARARQALQLRRRAIFFRRALEHELARAPPLSAAPSAARGAGTRRCRALHRSVAAPPGSMRSALPSR